jgi:hypothetical protein
MMEKNENEMMTTTMTMVMVMIWSIPVSTSFREAVGPWRVHGD